MPATSNPTRYRVTDGEYEAVVEQQGDQWVATIPHTSETYEVERIFDQLEPALNTTEGLITTLAAQFRAKDQAARRAKEAVEQFRAGGE